MRLTLLVLLWFGFTGHPLPAQRSPDVQRSNRHFRLADSLANQGQYEKALSYGRQALKVRQGTPEDSQPIEDAYELLGTIYMEMGKYEQSLACYRRALKSSKDHGGDTHLAVARHYDNVGAAYQHQGAHDQALAYYYQALAIKKESWGEAHLSIAESYRNIGKVHQHRQAYDRALVYYRQALAIKKELIGEGHPEVALIYHNLGNTYRDQGKYDQALTYHQKALAIIRKALGTRHPSIAMSYNNLGTLHRDRQEYKPALEYHYRALDIMKQQLGAVNSRVAITYTRIGRVYHEQGNYSSALSAYRKAITANGASFPDTSVYTNPTLEHYVDGKQLLFTLSAKAQSLFALQRDSLACDTYRVADQLLAQLSRLYATRGDKVLLVSTAKELYERAVRTALRQYHTSQDHHYLELAFYFSERSKAGVLTEALSTLEAKQFGQLPDSLLTLEASLKADRSFYQSQLVTEDSSRYKRKLFIVNQRYDSLTQVLETQYPDYYQLKYATRTVSVAAVQSQLTPEEAVITYFRADSLWYALAITTDRFQAVPLLSDTLLTAHLTAFQQELRSGSTTPARYQTSAYALYQQLLVPLIEDSLLANRSRLTIIPDGPLGYLPFELLLTERPTTETDYAELPYLLRDYTVHYGYSATWLFHPFTRSGPPAQDQYIAFAPSYADFSSDSVPSLAQGRSHVAVAPLYFNRQEASNIGQYLPGVALTDQEAVEGRFKREAHRYNVIHLAMHALVDEENPTNSRLIFSRDTTDSLEDGYLYAYELYDMELSADLAVLSACETGYGKLVQGEGIMSLARAFAYAGCSSIVMSHWLVDDAASAQLMDYFYHNLSEGLPKDEALRQAKLAYINDVPSRKAHPYFWSNFVLVGDVAPIATPMRMQAILAYVLGGLALGAGGGLVWYVYRRRLRALVMRAYYLVGNNNAERLINNE